MLKMTNYSFIKYWIVNLFSFYEGMELEVQLNNRLINLRHRQYFSLTIFRAKRVTNII